jgi:hypothetical protein
MILFSVTIDKTRRKKNWNKDEEEISTRVYTNSTPMTSAKRTRGMSRGFHERQWGCCHLSHTKFVLLNHQYHNFHIVSFHLQVCHTTFWCIVRFRPHASLTVLSSVKRGLVGRWMWDFKSYFTIQWNLNNWAWYLKYKIKTEVEF